LQDKQDLQRVVLFSDSPQEEALEKQDLSLKICDSKETILPFDLAKLQSESIPIEDKKRSRHPSCLYEIVSTISYLSYPFSVSKLIVFQPKYKVQNKTHKVLHFTQFECEEKGVFSIYPFETSVFHWTDSSKRNHISLKLDDYEYSGPFDIDSIGEITLRLNSTYEPEAIIV
jgi:hypothetical protein